MIYDPIKNEMFVAEKGGGAFMNDRRLRVSARKSLGDSLMATGILVFIFSWNEFAVALNLTAR